MIHRCRIAHDAEFSPGILKVDSGNAGILQASILAAKMAALPSGGAAIICEFHQGLS